MDVAFSLLSDCDLCGAESEFTEGRVLDVVALVAMVELFQKCRAEHSFAFAVDENYFLSLVLEIGVHDLAELVNLKIEDVGRSESCGSVDKFVDMEVYFDDFRTL